MDGRPIGFRLVQRKVETGAKVGAFFVVEITRPNR
jgi:hypothetical protein